MLTVPQLTLTPDDNTSISSFTISGQGVIESSQLGILPAAYSGEVFSATPGTYSIE